MYGFCSSKALYSASLLFTMFIGPAAVARWVLQSVWVFAWNWIISFFLFWHGARNPNDIVSDRTDFFRKTFFAPNIRKMGQNWAINNFF